MKRFLGTLVRVFEVRPGGTHIAIVVYGTNAQVALTLKEFVSSRLTVSDLRKRIDSLPRQIGLRFIDKALRVTEREVFTKAGGVRNNVPKVC